MFFFQKRFVSRTFINISARILLKWRFDKNSAFIEVYIHLKLRIPSPSFSSTIFVVGSFVLLFTLIVLKGIITAVFYPFIPSFLRIAFSIVDLSSIFFSFSTRLFLFYPHLRGVFILNVFDIC